MTRATAAALVIAALARSVVAQPATRTDELSQAADAVAEVAAVTARRAVAVADPLAPSSDAIDLGAIGLDPSAPAFDDKLNLYGFADIGYLSDNWSRDPVVFPQYTRGFLVGNLNLYIARNLTARARALAEVRFTFLPNGSQNADGSVVDTTALDPTNYYRPTQWGGVVIERAYVEYDLTEHLTLRGGHWLTPYGIWNIDHGSPTVIIPFRPYVVGENFFPEHQTGLDLFGRYHRAAWELGYHLTASNGRGATEAQSDQDNKFAFGGRLELETPWGLKVGGSYYRGRYTGVATTAGTAPDTYLERGYGLDAQLDRGALHIQAELIVHDRHGASGPDGRDVGFYALAGYRFDRLWNVMPFVFVEDEQPGDHTYFTHEYDAEIGVNFRPTANLVFKLIVGYIGFADGSGALDGESLRECAAQASWMF